MEMLQRLEEEDSKSAEGNGSSDALSLEERLAGLDFGLCTLFPMDVIR